MYRSLTSPFGGTHWFNVHLLVLETLIVELAALRYQNPIHREHPSHGSHSSHAPHSTRIGSHRRLASDTRLPSPAGGKPNKVYIQGGCVLHSSSVLEVYGRANGVWRNSCWSASLVGRRATRVRKGIPMSIGSGLGSGCVREIHLRIIAGSLHRNREGPLIGRSGRR